MTYEEHQEIVDAIYRRMRKNKRYDRVAKNLEYHVEGRDGEFDIYAIRGKRGVYIDVKSHDSVKSYRCALNQFERVRDLFRQFEWTMWYYTPETSFVRVRDE